MAGVLVEHTFPETPEGYVGCVTCHCGDARAQRRPTRTNPVDPGMGLRTLIVG